MNIQGADANVHIDYDHHVAKTDVIYIMNKCNSMAH